MKISARQPKLCAILLCGRSLLQQVNFFRSFLIRRSVFGREPKVRTLPNLGASGHETTRCCTIIGYADKFPPTPPHLSPLSKVTLLLPCLACGTSSTLSPSSLLLLVRAPP